MVTCIHMYDSDRYLYLALLSALMLCSFASRMQLNNCFSFVNYILRDELFVTQYSTLVECLLASHVKKHHTNPFRPPSNLYREYVLCSYVNNVSVHQQRIFAPQSGYVVHS